MEHVVAAEELVRLAADGTYAFSTVNAQLAQVHATLALAEQTRIANMQTERGLLWQKSGRVVGTEAMVAAGQARALDAHIREGLGFDTGPDAA